METASKQSVTGFKVINFQSKTSKDTEKVRLVLEAEVDTMGAGTYDVGDILKALLHHQTGQIDVGLSVFVNSALPSSEEDTP